MKPSTNEASRAAEASDIEQKLGHGGNMRDSGPGAELPPNEADDPLGSSGHIKRLEEVAPDALKEHSGSPGADADRQMGSRERPSLPTRTSER